MRAWVMVCVAALLSGCATEPAAPRPTTAYAGTVISTITHRNPPPFDVITWTGTMMMNPQAADREGLSEGNGLVKAFQIADPAPAIAASLASGLSQSLKTFPGEPIVTDLFSFFPGGPGLLLPVATESWGVAYIPSDPAHYQVKYMGVARLMDNAHPHDVASVTCRWQSPEKAAPGYDELLGDSGALLKQMLTSAAQDCAARFRDQILAAAELQQKPVN